METVIERTYIQCKKCGKKAPFQTRENGKIVWLLKDFELSAFIAEHKHTQFFDLETEETKHDSNTGN